MRRVWRPLRGGSSRRAGAFDGRHGGSAKAVRRLRRSEAMRAQSTSPSRSCRTELRQCRFTQPLHALRRKSVGEGKSVSVRVDFGGRRIIKKKKMRERI